MKKKVFISYSGVDADFAGKAADMLSSIGIDYFFDKKEIGWGEPIRERVQGGLSDCSAIVVIISPASLKSQWVLFEIGFGMGRQKKVLPLLTHPSLEVPAYLQGIHYETSLEGAKSYFMKYFGEFRNKTPSDAKEWLSTSRKDVQVAVLTPADNETVDKMIIGSSGFVAGLSDNSQFLIQAFVTTDRDYQQGSSMLDEDGYWEIKEIHLGGTHHKLFFRIYNKDRRLITESKHMSIFKVALSENSLGNR